jgi:hypothetical protein
MTDLISSAASDVMPSVRALPVITWQQARVITTELLARQYGTDENNIQQNFARNADRFIEGTHFFKLQGEALREFKRSITGAVPVSREHNELTVSKTVSSSDGYPESVGVVPKHARQIILWTERGAARHAKMLDTDAAWDVFEQLEDCYFRVKGMLEAQSAPMSEARILARSDTRQGYRMMSGMVAMQRESVGKACANYHFTNEALMVNEVVFGERKSIDRDALSAEDLARLAKVEMRNTLLIGQGLDYAERKAKLVEYVETLSVVSVPAPSKRKALKTSAKISDSQQ